MIQFINNKEVPITIFQKFHENGLLSNQPNIDAACLSTFNTINNEISSRFINIKYVKNNKFIFFSNYESPKAKDIKTFNKVSCVFFWPNINLQVRIQGSIKKTTEKCSDEHFNNRTKEKNILSIISNQSRETKTYDNFVKKYYKFIENYDRKINRPNYWGGYEITPIYYEFWEGHKNRLNKRLFYRINDSGIWESGYLEP